MSPHLRLTGDALQVARQGLGHARRLGHRHLGAEHFLLALAGAGHPAGAVLRANGVTPAGVEDEIVRLAGRDAAAALLGDLDREALAAIGVDVGAVRGQLEASFGQRALAAADRTVHGPPGRVSRRPPRFGGAREGGYALPHAPSGFAALGNARREAQAWPSAQVGVQHLALGVIAVGAGLVPDALAGLGVPAPILRAAVIGAFPAAG